MRRVHETKTNRLKIRTIELSQTSFKTCARIRAPILNFENDGRAESAGSGSLAKCSTPRVEKRVVSRHSVPNTRDGIENLPCIKSKTENGNKLTWVYRRKGNVYLGFIRGVGG